MRLDEVAWWLLRLVVTRAASRCALAALRASQCRVATQAWTGGPVHAALSTGSPSTSSSMVTGNSFCVRSVDALTPTATMPEDSAVAPAPTTTVPNAGEVTATSYGGVVTDTVTVTIVGALGTNAHVISIPSGSTSLQASYAIIAGLATDPHVTATYDPGSSQVLLVAKTPGLAGNSITYTLAEGAAAPVEFTFADAAAPFNTGNLSGGFDGPKAAVKTVNDLELVAAYEGVFGNTINVTFVPGDRKSVV